MISIHASYYGDNFGDTLFVIQYINYLNDCGYKPEEIALPFAGKRMRTYVNISSTKGIAAILKSEKIVFIGGGYFGERKYQKTIWHIRFWIRHISVALLAKFLHKEYIFLGVGAGPLNNNLSRALTKYVVNHSRGFYARDIKSLEFLGSFCEKEKIFLVSDSLISYTSHKNDSELVKKTLLFHLPLHQGVHDQLKVFIQLVNEVFDKSHEIIVTRDFYKPSFNRIDYDIIKGFYPDTKFIDYKSPEQFLSLLNRSEYIFTVKLHAGILGIGAGRKVFSTYVHEKTPRFYKQANLSKYCFDYFQIDKNQKEITKALIHFRESPETPVIPVEIMKLSKMNFKVLDRFLRNEL